MRFLRGGYTGAVPPTVERSINVPSAPMVTLSAAPLDCSLCEAGHNGRKKQHDCAAH